MKDTVNEWLERLGFAERLKVYEGGGRLKDAFSVTAYDPSTKVEVGLPDVGFGLGQVLPIIVQCVPGQLRLPPHILVEQPELHLHPRMQANLGDLFCATTKVGGRLIVETHSEHLLWRIQTLVRRGELMPEDVAVVHIGKGPEGAQATEIRFDDDGAFLDPWPDDFFEQEYSERLGWDN